MSHNRTQDLNDAVDIVTRWLRLFFHPGDVTELRAIKVSRARYRKLHTEAGFYDYDHLSNMAADALEVTRQAQGVYFTMNPLKPHILARRANRIEPAPNDSLAHDTDVAERRWLLVDCDPERDSHISATDAEKSEAWKTILAIRDWLAGDCWPEPILADSGNGYHLFYRVEGLPATKAGDKVIKAVLHALKDRFETRLVKLDTSVFNAARIVKLPGTFGRKGDDLVERPHRRAKLLYVPGVGDVRFGRHAPRGSESVNGHTVAAR